MINCKNCSMEIDAETKSLVIKEFHSMGGKKSWQIMKNKRKKSCFSEMGKKGSAIRWGKKQNV